MNHVHGGTRRVLVVEDDRTTRRLLQRTLERSGYEVALAEDGREALEIQAQRPCRLVISDWEMPRMDGPELCRRLRSEASGTYVYIMLLTSRQGKESVVAGLAAGADDFLSKPFFAAELEARLQVGLRIVRLQDDLQHKTRLLEVLNAELATMADTDHLMGIGNRRRFDEAARRVHAAAVRYGRPYGVLMVDVDRFKSFNDRYGHQAGDDALRAVARCIRESLRADDEVFRYGGEELVVLLTADQPPQLLAVGERLRTRIAELGIPHAVSEGGHLTASIGGACFDPSLAGETGSGWPEVVRRADEALYRAKEHGRNRVAVQEDARWR